MNKANDDSTWNEYIPEDAKTDRLHHLAQDLISFRKDLDTIASDLEQRAVAAFQSPNKYFVTDGEWRKIIELVGDIKKLVEDRAHQTAVTANRDLELSARDVGKMFGIGANTVSRWVKKEEETGTKD